MARPLRIEYPGAFCHVVNRGRRQEPIVLDRRDRERFLSDLGRLSGRFHVLIHRYCLMTNHYHLAQRMAKDPALTESVAQIRAGIANS